MAPFSRRLLVIFDRSISHPRKATAVVRVFVQNFSGWALILGHCIEFRKSCGLYRLHKVFVATESRIVVPKNDHVNPDLFLSVIFLKVPNPQKTDSSEIIFQAFVFHLFHCFELRSCCSFTAVLLHFWFQDFQ